MIQTFLNANGAQSKIRYAKPSKAFRAKGASHGGDALDGRLEPPSQAVRNE
jgi:hypothetical protein